MLQANVTENSFDPFFCLNIDRESKDGAMWVP